MKTPNDPDRLDAHFQALRQGEAKARLIEGAPDNSVDLISLFAIVDMLWRILRPVAIAPAFRDELKLQLMTEAQRRETRKVLGLYPQRQGLNPIWLVPFAALGTASLVGALVWRRARHQVEPDTALAA
ncbi:MAG: hypothetical protein J5I90_01525 [Caldilineales bacterium]|nr:hypothetical protein [Caldilineales bacterium]